MYVELGWLIYLLITAFIGTAVVLLVLVELVLYTIDMIFAVKYTETKKDKKSKKKETKAEVKAEAKSEEK